MDGFYIVNTEKFFNTITKDLKSSGYEWVGVNKNPTFLECKKQIHGNAKLIIHAFYNDITRKNEIQFGTKRIYRSYQQFKRIKYINDLQRLKDMDYSTFHNWIYSALSKAIEDDKKQNSKLDVLLEEYSAVRMAITEDQQAINEFIDNVCEIADLVNSDNWNGEDVMAIFFNEFNRYRGKADAGQVFTPDHITSFMYRILDVNMYDRVLDATCGSGAFLVKAMCNMIKEAGGVNSDAAKRIKSEQLFGIEMYRKVYALACANMMIHKDGKTNLAQMDAKSEEAGKWIEDKNISKVLMNPPYERKYGCADIVINVLDHVPVGTAYPMGTGTV